MEGLSNVVSIAVKKGKPTVQLEWNRSETIALAKSTCTHCRGLGLRQGRKGKKYPCNCVFRAIFRACYTRFRDCVEQERYLSTISLDWCADGSGGKRFYGRKLEEYMADFCLVSRRTLIEPDYKIFRYHYVLGADWKLCCRRLGMDRGNFFHSLYRIEQKLGRTFRELRPYPLFPLDEYFHGTVRNPIRPIGRPRLAVMPLPELDTLPQIA